MLCTSVAILTFRSGCLLLCYIFQLAYMHVVYIRCMFCREVILSTGWTLSQCLNYYVHMNRYGSWRASSNAISVQYFKHHTVYSTLYITKPYTYICLDIVYLHICTSTFSDNIINAPHGSFHTLVHPELKMNKRTLVWQSVRIPPGFRPAIITPPPSTSRFGAVGDT
jgi:hypothetical protein